MSFSISSTASVLQQQLFNSLVNVITTSVVASTISFTPTGIKTALRLDTPLDNTSGSLNITLNPNISNSLIGSQLIVYLEIADPGGNTVTLNFPSDRMYITFCGSPSTNQNIENFERIAIVFNFDGTKFISTYDNC